MVRILGGLHIVAFILQPLQPEEIKTSQYPLSSAIEVLGGKDVLLTSTDLDITVVKFPKEKEGTTEDSKDLKGYVIIISVHLSPLSDCIQNEGSICHGREGQSRQRKRHTRQNAKG
jgi:hypothetical protein